MKDEIKEIFDIWADDDGEIVVHYIDKNNNKQEYKMITREDLLDYITNLQNQLEEKTYLYNKLDIESKYAITNLQEENKKLDSQNTLNKLYWEKLEQRIDKAIEYINYYGITPEENDDITVRHILKGILNILNGEEK